MEIGWNTVSRVANEDRVFKGYDFLCRNLMNLYKLLAYRTGFFLLGKISEFPQQQLMADVIILKEYVETNSNVKTKMQFCLKDIAIF